MKHNINEMQRSLISDMAVAAYESFRESEENEKILSSGYNRADKKRLMVMCVYGKAQELLLSSQLAKLDLGQYLRHIFVETVKPF